MWILYLFNDLSAGGYLWVAEKPFALPNKEMGYLWVRGNPHLIYTFSIMVTTEENTTYAPGLSLNENPDSSNKKSWAVRVQEFSSNLD